MDTTVLLEPESDPDTADGVLDRLEVLLSFIVDEDRMFVSAAYGAGIETAVDTIRRVLIERYRPS